MKGSGEDSLIFWGWQILARNEYCRDGLLSLQQSDWDFQSEQHAEVLVQRSEQNILGAQLSTQDFKSSGKFQAYSQWWKFFQICVFIGSKITINAQKLYSVD